MRDTVGVALGHYMVPVFMALLVVLASSTGCASRPHSGQGLAAPASGPPNYVRIAGDRSNTVSLQIALCEFVPHRKGPAVWLCAVSHIGESNYYASLQRELDGHTLVLFEGIRPQPIPGDEDVHAVSDAAVGGSQTSPTAQSHQSSLQIEMAKSLGLVFQLDAIDYNRTNFVNSDLSIEGLRKVLSDVPEKPGEPSASQGFEGLMQVMQGESWINTLLQFGFRFISISPKLQAMSRYLLVELLNEMQGDPAQLAGLPGGMQQLVEVLVQRRDEKVIADLRVLLPKMGRRSSVAVFYGAGHMPDLQRRLCDELRYRPSRQVWLTAFSVDLAKAGVSRTEQEWMEGLVKSQLRLLRAGSSRGK